MILHGDVARGGLALRGGPDLARVRPHVGHAVERLHGRVREIRHFVDRFDALRRAGERGLGVAVLASHRARLRRQIDEKRRMAALDAPAFGPSSQRISSALRPSIAVQVLSATTATPLEIRDHALDAGNGLGLRGVEARHFAAEDRAASHHRVQHSGKAHIDAEVGAAVDFAGRVETLAATCRSRETAAGSFRVTFVGGAIRPAASARLP